MTGGQLFDRIIEQARENGDLARFDAIDEYILDDTSDKGKLCSYEFDLLPAMNFGGSRESTSIAISRGSSMKAAGIRSISGRSRRSTRTSTPAKVMGETLRRADVP